MIEVSAYLKSEEYPLLNNEEAIVVNSAGYYKFKTRDVRTMNRTKGRDDYQLIYVAKGKGYFTFNEQEEVVAAGHLVIYRPGDKQLYRYDYHDQSHIYWIHLTGSEVERYLGQLDFGERAVYDVGFKSEVTALWKEIITELQVKRRYFEGIIGGLTLQLLSTFARNSYEGAHEVSSTHRALQEIIAEMHHRTEETVMIKDYAARCNMSVCWFINSFKELTGMTPGQYMTHIQINKAKTLLSGTQLNVNEVAEIVGFHNPFYFSKVFKKLTHMTPSEFKKL